MSLSDYDTLAFDENAQPTNGVIEGFVAGTACEIYKNWLYVRDESAWGGGRSYMRPTIAEVRSGDLCLAGFDIEAVRGPQEAIFVKVTATRYKEQKEGEPYQPPDVRRMAGIGCCGYYTPFDLVAQEEGLDPAEWIPLSTGGSFGEEPALVFTFGKVGEDELREFERAPGGAYETCWVGLLPSTFAAFITWLKTTGSSDEHNAWVAAIEKAEPLRVNQGDALFERAGVEKAPVTPPGEAPKPLFQQINEADDDE